jgi:hypothetical protein
MTDAVRLHRSSDGSMANCATDAAIAVQAVQRPGLAGAVPPSLPAGPDNPGLGRSDGRLSPFIHSGAGSKDSSMHDPLIEGVRTNHHGPADRHADVASF